MIFLDSAGQPVRGEDRYARYHAEYDAYGNCIQEEYFNENGEPDYNHLGYAKAKARYDGRGFQTLYQVYSPMERRLLKRTRRPCVGENLR